MNSKTTLLGAALLISSCQLGALGNFSSSTENHSDNIEDEKIAANDLGDLSQGDVELSFLRFLCVSIEAHAHRDDGTTTNLAAYPIIFGLMPETLCVALFQVKNHGSQTCNFDPYLGSTTFLDHENLRINSSEYNGYPGNIDFIGGPIPANTEYLTGVIVPVPEISWNNLGRIAYQIPGPVCNGETIATNPYQFLIDTTGWTYEEVPGELKDIADE